MRQPHLLRLFFSSALLVIVLSACGGDVSQPSSMGQLVLSYAPPGADISLTNQRSGDSVALDEALLAESATEDATVKTFTLEPGTYDIEVTMSGYQPGRVVKTVNVDAVVRVEVKLEPTPVPDGQKAPHALFSADTLAGTAPLTVRFDASDSFDEDGEIVRYDWDFGDGASGSGALLEHVYSAAGRYTVVLSVTDDDGITRSVSDTVSVRAADALVAAFETQADPDDPLKRLFDASSSSGNEVEAYTWDFGDGATGSGQKVEHRFEKTGEYEVTLKITDASGTSASVTETLTIFDTATYPLEPLSASADGHTFLAGGEPFFWLGDTAWALFSMTTREDVTLYLEDALGKGFTVIQVFLTTAWSDNGDNGENAYGEAPFVANDPTRLNPAYFEHVEWVVDEAAKRGLYTVIVYGEVGRTDDGRVPYTISTPEEGYTYANAVGQRFRRQTLANNIIWLNGQDRSPDKDLLKPGWNAMFEGLADGINGVDAFDEVADYSTTFTSYHTDGCCTSGYWYHSKASTDFNAINTWKNYDKIVPLITLDYERDAPKPIACLEHSYEEQHYDGEFRGDWHARFQGYWCLLSGAASYAYGYLDGYRLTASRDWPGYFDKPGRVDMLHLKTVMTSRPVHTRVPDQSLIVSDTGTPDVAKDYVVAARAKDGSYAFVYATDGRSFELDLAKLAGTGVKAQWFDPREGSFQALGSFTKGVEAFDPPGDAGEGNDWLLVLDALP